VAGARQANAGSREGVPCPPVRWEYPGVSETAARPGAEGPSDAPDLSPTLHHISMAKDWVASNYSPLPVVIAHAEGAWVTDVEGRRYLDALAGYSALNFGHLHPTLIAAARAQLERLTLTSRAFHSDRLGPFSRELATLAGKDLVLPMNTGAEAVETAIKTARRWGYEVKGVPDGRARIIAMAGNFHGRTTTIISFSDDPLAREHYGPFTPGFDLVPFGDIAALEAAITDETVAVLLEPVQGEGGVIIPPEGWLRDVRELTRRLNVLMVADEIQSGLGRTGTTFACDLEGVVPDVYVLGKALGGGIVPLSAVVADRDVLGVFTPGSHGSTFGGNPLAAAVGQAVVELLATGEYQARARTLGAVLDSGLRELLGHGVDAVRCRGLWAGIDIDPRLMTGREASHRLLVEGVLVKDTHGSTVRLAPPLVVGEAEVEILLAALGKVLRG
jgi:ornithine--oxo-acid transaminase